jgi:uncharacterized protein YbcV (DUF1398 family)
MNTAVMRNTLAASEAGQITFPQVVSALVGAGVESYFIDLARGTATYYLPTGETHMEQLSHPTPTVAADFSPAGLIAAIRQAQADPIRYPEFIRQSTAAGTIACWAFLVGRKVIYYGRKGDFHIEAFPGAPEPAGRSSLAF